jgi:mannose-6-phosphate isomerase class I
VYEKSQSEDMISDSVIIELQRLAINKLQQDKAELVVNVTRLEDDNKRLLHTNKQQTDHQFTILNGYVRRRALEIQGRAQAMKDQGEYLLTVAEGENTVYGHESVFMQ